MNTQLTPLEQELADLVKSKGLVLRKDIVRMYEDRGVPEGTISARLSGLSYELNVIKQCKINRQGTFVYWPGTPLPKGAVDYGHGRTIHNRNRREHSVLPSQTTKTDVWITDKPGEFPICCVVDGKPWFFTIDSIKQLYSQFKLMEGAFK